MKPTCPECGSDNLFLVHGRAVSWTECIKCKACYIASRDRLIESCLLSHKDAQKPDVSPEFVTETGRLLRSLVIKP